MKLLDFKTTIEGSDTQRAAGRHNPAVAANWEFNRTSYSATLSAGYGDYLTAYREGNLVYFLAYNSSLDYAGIEVFEMLPGGLICGPESLFLQGSEQLEECLGKRALDLAPYTIIRRMANYLS